jgi:hypothetical protein
MESRKRRRDGIRASRVTGSAYPNIAELIENGGQISIGALPPIKCAAVANDDYNCLAMLKRRPGESLQQLLERLDAAIHRALVDEQFTDEINEPPTR